MCGIAGTMTADGTPPSPEILAALVKALRHRGPDGHGQYVKDDTGLIQTRLAIIDLVTGDQPLFDADGAALVANGEIYNYIELRAAMPEVAFRTQSDCEVPLHLYRQRGAEFARTLRGMYAIAIHDPVAGRLLLARDPFGIKPIYYAETPQGFVFASEPKAILATGLLERKLVAAARDELMQLHYVTREATAYQGIRRVLPGETLVIARGRIVERRRISALPSSGIVARNDDDAIAELDRVLEDSVRVHQRSDVPYGMFLSGGIDSSAILAMMARCNDKPVKAFTAGFSGTKVADERLHARKVAAAFGAEHIEVEFGESDFWSLLPAIAAVLDDPTTDYATLPTFKLAAAARQAGLKVILSGEGGDELFAGYGRYRRLMRPWWLGGRQVHAHGTFDGLGVLREPSSAWRRGLEEAEATAQQSGWTRLQKAQAADCRNWLPNDLLIKLDRCLMAQGVEGRTPFLDPEMARFAFALPDGLKIRDGMGKWILRQWLQRHAPVAEPFAKKRGFTVPVAEWIARRGDAVGTLVARQECVREFCHADCVADLFKSSQEKRAGFAAWSLLFYALWHKHHIEQTPIMPDVFVYLSM